MPPKPRRTKSLTSFQHESNKTSQWDDDDSDSNEQSNSPLDDPIFTLPNGIAVRRPRRTDAKAMHKGLNDPVVSHCYPDTVFPQPYGLWRVHKQIEEELDPKENWRRYNPSTPEGTPTHDTYQTAVDVLADMNLEGRLAKRGDQPSTAAAPSQKKDTRPLVPVLYAITQDDVFVGVVALDFDDTLDLDNKYHLDPAFLHEGQISYWLCAEYRKRGIMTAVVQRFMQWSWDSFAQLETITAWVYSSWNPASRKLLQKCGFDREGVLKGGIRKDGQFGNVEIWTAYRSGGKVDQAMPALAYGYDRELPLRPAG